MPSTINLDATVRGIVNGLGAAIIQLGPVSNQEQWTVNRIIVNCDGAASSVCAVYRNKIDASQEIASTISGNNDTDYQENLQLAYGEYLFVVWATATPGANVSASAQGSKQIAGRIY